MLESTRCKEMGPGGSREGKGPSREQRREGFWWLKSAARHGGSDCVSAVASAKWTEAGGGSSFRESEQQMPQNKETNAKGRKRGLAMRSTGRNERLTFRGRMEER